MNARPPRILARQSADNPLEALEHEVLQEKLATLSRLGRRLEQALERLATCEGAPGGEPGGAAEAREELLAEAGEALWLRGTEQALRAYCVPPALRARMGMTRPRGRRG